MSDNQAGVARGLQARQIAERNRLQCLADAMKSDKPVGELCTLLRDYAAFHGENPAWAIKEALNYYLTSQAAAE
ncbi:hypothetical protein ACFOY8_13625 [Thalassospira xianhensis]|uniref:Uncharacterized protein n=2 Tax=Thalassospira TaxID=168934 RepID=A0A285TSI9_9PROT|nr:MULTISPECIES: hypothetical protein [Thalassospira]RCK07775.1 hypothetical protein TH5_01655 [Thalassospira xianhensis MCCC 1A02616]SOC26875.1 hypothetical protein SAMN05428964_105224 [Thalassospira xiamenensis]